MKRIFQKKESRIPFTQEGYNKILAEKASLVSDRPDAVENLRKARDMGDLSENGYYKAARARLSFIDARLRRLERLIKLAVVVKPRGSGLVEIGSTVHISDGNSLFIYMIVGGYESDPSKKTISHHSPLGRALMGGKEGDKVEVCAPAGNKHYTILHIT